MTRADEEDEKYKRSVINGEEKILENIILETGSFSTFSSPPYASMVFSILFSFVINNDAKLFKQHPSLVNHSSQAAVHKTVIVSRVKKPLPPYD